MINEVQWPPTKPSAVKLLVAGRVCSFPQPIQVSFARLSSFHSNSALKSCISASRQFHLHLLRAIFSCHPTSSILVSLSKSIAQHVQSIILQPGPTIPSTVVSFASLTIFHSSYYLANAWLPFQDFPPRVIDHALGPILCHTLYNLGAVSISRPTLHLPILQPACPSCSIHRLTLWSSLSDMEADTLLKGHLEANITSKALPCSINKALLNRSL